MSTHKKSAPAAATEAAGRRDGRGRASARARGALPRLRRPPLPPLRPPSRRRPRRRETPRRRRPGRPTSTPPNRAARAARRRRARSTTDRHREKPSTKLPGGRAFLEIATRTQPRRASRASTAAATAPRDLVRGSPAIEDERRRIGGDEAGGSSRRRAPEPRRRRSARRRGPRPAAARGRDVDGNVEQQREIGGAQPAREARDPVAVGLLGLVGERGHHVPVGHDVGPRGELRLDLAPR